MPSIGQSFRESGGSIAADPSQSAPAPGSRRAALSLRCPPFRGVRFGIRCRFRIARVFDQPLFVRSAACARNIRPKILTAIPYENLSAAKEVTRISMALNVLIVDDSAAIRKILQRVLRQTDIQTGEILEAGDGKEALKLLKNTHVGLVLSDINMPDMDWLQLLSELKAKAEWKRVPIVMITTEGSHNKVLEAVNLGAAGYVRKPFTAEQIKQKLVGLL